jgi:hypothetical protein
VILLQVKREEGLEDGHMLGSIHAWGDVHDDEPVYAGRLREGELHGHLAAEGMTEDMRAVELARVKKFDKVANHDAQGHVIAVRGKAVVAQVDEEDAEMLSEFGSDTKPVIGRAKKAVEHYQRRALAEFFEIKLH